MAIMAGQGRFGSLEDYYGFAGDAARLGVAAFISRWTADPVKPERVALEFSSDALGEALARLGAIGVAFEGDGDVAGALRAFCEAHVDGEVELAAMREDDAADMRRLLELAGELLDKGILRARQKESGLPLSELGAIIGAPEPQDSSA